MGRNGAPLVEISWDHLLRLTNRLFSGTQNMSPAFFNCIFVAAKILSCEETFRQDLPKYVSTSANCKKTKLVQSCDAANFKRLYVFPCKVEGPTNNMFFLFCHKILAYHTLNTLTDTEVCELRTMRKFLGWLAPCFLVGLATYLPETNGHRPHLENHRDVLFFCRRHLPSLSGNGSAILRLGSPFWSYTWKYLPTSTWRVTMIFC